jgi:CheY-like chemotaxis protein
VSEDRPIILVVEDDAEIRGAILEILEDRGYEPRPAINGKDALSILAQLKRRPCLILLDVMMPVMDGRTFREVQLRSPQLADIPVVMISASRDVEDTAAELGVLEYLKKPVEMRTLLSLTERYCREATG